MTVQNPTEKDCWTTCTSCYRCADRGRFAKCEACSGRADPNRRIYPDPDDYCDCKNGILRYRAQNGRQLLARLSGNPFAGKVVSTPMDSDERDWEAYLTEVREKRDEPDWDPIQFYDGTSVDRYLKKK